MANYQDTTLAFAGVCQAVRLVQSFAMNGTADREAFEVLLKSLLVTQPDNILSVYGDKLANLKLGLETSLAQLSGSGQGQLDGMLSRYWIAVLALSIRLNKNSQAKNALIERLQRVERQLSLYDGNIMAEQMIANFSAIYSEVLSPLMTKIRVFGDQDFLARPDIQNRVRASLLAGVRAGILWQQVGGAKWHFLFSRRKMLKEAKQLYAQVA